jgi:hypothetical protein
VPPGRASKRYCDGDGWLRSLHSHMVMHRMFDTMGAMAYCDAPSNDKVNEPVGGDGGGGSGGGGDGGAAQYDSIGTPSVGFQQG